jgi:hypothetical protein
MMMCVIIEVDGARIETAGELRDAIGPLTWNNPEWPDMISRKGADAYAECLCPVDIHATALANGYAARPGWDSACCDFILERNGAPQ